MPVKVALARTRYFTELAADGAAYVLCIGLPHHSPKCPSYEGKPPLLLAGDMHDAAVTESTCSVSLFLAAELSSF